MSRRPQPKSAQVLQREVDEFNAANPIGSEVTVRLDSGLQQELRTVSEAWTMGGHSNVVKLQGLSGAFALERVKKGWDEVAI